MLEDIFGCYHHGHPVGSGQGYVQCPAMTTKVSGLKITGSENTQSVPWGQGASVNLCLLGRAHAVGKHP